MERTDEYYPPLRRHRKLMARVPIVLVAVAYLLAIVGFVLSLAGRYEYHAGNLIILGGLCLFLALTWYQFAEKRRYR